MSWFQKIFTAIENWVIDRYFGAKITSMETKPTPAIPAVPEFPPKIIEWAQAIGMEEGANPESNNPGNLKYSTLTASWGATKGRAATDGGFLCNFSTLAQGTKALCNFLVLACEGELIISHPQPCSITDFTKRYAGNPPQGYIDAIIAKIGCQPNTDIAVFLL
jgi:hypothetical protein